MNNIRLGREFYPKLREIEDWLIENVGPGGYSYGEDNAWRVETVFGYSTYTFKHEGDLKAFSEEWVK